MFLLIEFPRGREVKRERENPYFKRDKLTAAASFERRYLFRPCAKLKTRKNEAERRHEENPD